MSLENGFNININITRHIFWKWSAGLNNYFQTFSIVQENVKMFALFLKDTPELAWRQVVQSANMLVMFNFM